MPEIKELSTLISASIASASLTPDKSFSVIVIGHPELAKTLALLKYAGTDSITVQTDLTYYGMKETLLPKIAAGLVKTIIIPDLLKSISKRTSTVKNFMTALNSLIEEGVFDITTKGGQSFGGARCNLLTSVTPAIYFDNRRSWTKIGFPSRVVPFSYSYDKTMTQEVFNEIRQYKSSFADEILMLPKEPRQIEITEEQKALAERCGRELALKEAFVFTTKAGRKITIDGGIGFRHTKQFMSLLKSLALLRDGTKVEKKDVDLFKKVYKYINYDRVEVTADGQHGN